MSYFAYDVYSYRAFKNQGDDDNKQAQKYLEDLNLYHDYNIKLKKKIKEFKSIKLNSAKSPYLISEYGNESEKSRNLKKIDPNSLKSPHLIEKEKEALKKIEDLKIKEKLSYDITLFRKNNIYEHSLLEKENKDFLLDFDGSQIEGSKYFKLHTEQNNEITKNCSKSILNEFKNHINKTNSKISREINKLKEEVKLKTEKVELLKIKERKKLQKWINKYTLK